MDTSKVTGIAIATAIIVVPVALLHIKINSNRVALSEKLNAKAFRING